MDIDPVFTELVKSIYGDTDPREIWDVVKIMPDQASISTPGQQQKRRKKIAAGLLLGSTAESLGTFRAGQSAVRAYKKPVVPKIPDTIHPETDSKAAAGALKRITMSPHGKAGEFALQAANLGVGLAAARELLKPNEEDKKKKPPKTTTSKGLFKPKVVRVAVGARPVSEAQIKANNIKTTKRARRQMVAATAVGAGAGSYIGMKKYGLKVVNPIQPTQQNKDYKKVKKNDETEYTWTGEISKVDPDKRLVFGWCSLSKVNGEPVVDLQGDYIPIEETENSAYRYVIESRKGGDMHRRVQKFDADEPLHTADLVESMVFTPEKLQKMGLPPDALPHGWWIGMKVNDDEQWANVKSGKRLGFSIHGKGRRVEKAL